MKALESGKFETSPNPKKRAQRVQTRKSDSDAGFFVLENQRGDTVRYMNLDLSSRSKVVVVYRLDNRRIETHPSTAILDENEIPYQVIAEKTPTQIQKSSLDIEGVGRIRWVANAGRLSQNYDLAPEKELSGKKLFGWSFGIQLGLVAILAIASALSGVNQATDESPTVTLIPQDVVEKMMAERTPPKRQDPPVVNRPRKAKPVRPARKKVVVAASTKKILKTDKVPTRSTSLKKKARVGRSGVKGGGHKSAGRRGSGTNEASMNQIGALGALSGASKKLGNGGRGGLNLQAAGRSDGSGAGGAGRGGFGRNGGGKNGIGGLGKGKAAGVSNALYGKGLVAAPFGDGAPSAGTGGYGTRGRAGGGARGAGYGSETVVGSWKGTGPEGPGAAGSGAGNGGSGSAFGDDDDVVVQGGLDRDQIAAVIQRYLGQITYCYEQGLQTKPSLSGRVSVKFRIGGSGRVETAGIAHSSVRSAKVENCIVGKLKAWRFPKPHGGVSVAVTYPFVLRRVTQR